MIDIDGGIVAPRGFRAATAACGIKQADRQDLLLITSDEPARCAALFTTNCIKAAPVLVSREHAKDGIARAIIANSGNANACTGEEGLESAAVMTAETARLLAIESQDVLVASTGVIGRRLPVERIIDHLPDAVASLNDSYRPETAMSIMTTDTVPKETAVEVELGDVTVRIGAVAKGAGMICPDMATMLAFITTDADISHSALKNALSEAVARSFNCITVDGDMSTNDTVMILANGAAGNPSIRSKTKNYQIFDEALTDVCARMAQAIVRDAEGATKFASIRITGAPSTSEARQVGLAIANSPLVKTAFFGNDANWGRIICAAGYSGVRIDESNVTISLNGITVFERGLMMSYDESAVTASLAHNDIEVIVDLGIGRAERTVYTSDLSYDYIRINAEYTT